MAARMLVAMEAWEAGSLDDDYDDECVDFMDLVVFCVILVDLYGFHGFLGPEVGQPVAPCGKRITRESCPY